MSTTGTGIMEWSTGDLVWFDPGVGHWLPGEVLECHRSANVLTVQAVINGKPQTFALSEGEGSVRRRQDLGTAGVEDMIQLQDLHEAALLWNLKLRYDRNLIYTYAGSILVAVNPYRMFDSSYGIESAQRYRGKMIGALPPHLFALGAAAYSALPAPQVVVISGESGSGKTESTKLVMQYLAAVAPSAPRGQALVTEQILEAAPLLEAFGNARTARNDNSSRFGKYLEVYFKHGSIIGAKMTQYLLEKSRIVTQAPGERNYHVFYELLGGLTKPDRQKYGLVDADKYFYLNQGGGDCAPGHSGSGADWGALTRAMQVLGVDQAEQEGIVKVLASVLHLGNVYFHRRQLRHGQEGVEVGSDVEIKWAAHLLQISAGGLQRALTSRITEARAERVYSPLSIDQALDARDAFAKALYSALFNWLVTRVNSIVQRGGLHDAARISLLDIFGFENLNENSFEQLCINFASESLQQYFNKHVFKLEQQEYARERLEWTNMTWLDNTPVIHLLGKKPVGILHLLDDESNFPRASDSSFLEKCHYNHALNEHYCRPRVGGREFGIRHFAGQVWYSVDGFLDKNRDALRPDVVELIASSKEPLVCAIAKPLLSQAQARTLPKGTNGRFVTMKPRTPTVAARFSDSLQQLLESMSRCNPWFVRCVKPNNDKSPMRFDMPVVLEQLRYSGMLDTIKIRQSGYPVRMKFQQFVDRYRYLLSGVLPRGAPYRDLCRAILERMPATGTEGPDYQLGATRVFLRESLERQLEIKRADCLRDSAVLIQKHIRGYLARKRYRNLRRSALTIQKHWKGYKQRRRYRTVRKGIVKAQALVRGRKERKRFNQRKAEFKRRLEAERLAQERARQNKAAREAQLLQSKPAPKQTTVHHLEIPAELAFIFSKLDQQSYSPTHTERNLIKVVGGVCGSPQALSLPQDLNQYEFSRFSSVYFKGADLGMKKEPITAPFLSKAATRDQDFQDAVALFKLILRWSNDAQLTGVRERALADYVIHKGLGARGLRDELLVQLCNQVWRNDENSDRIWQLMAHCLSCFQPSPPLSKYLLKFVTDHASPNYKEVLQRKITRGLQKAPHARSLPPTLLEWRSVRQRTNTALPLTLSDGNVYTVNVNSWTTCEEAASLAINALGVAPEGWTVVMDDAGVISEGNGLDYVMDLVSELELLPAFPVSKSSLLKIGTRNSSPVEVDRSTRQSPQPQTVASTPTRPQVPPPEPPIMSLPSSRKPSKEAISSSRQSPLLHRNSPVIIPHGSSQQMMPSSGSSRKPSRESREYSPSPQRNSPIVGGGPPATRKTSHEALSRSSALNERYFDMEKVRSRSLDNLLSEPEPPGPLVDLGLSQSRLNDRYHSVEQLTPIQPVLANQSYIMSKQEIEFEYPDVSSVSTSNRGGPRYIKSQYTGKKAPPGSHSSRAQIEKSEFMVVRSSAMSDTSETPSLASHVRRVRVPSQASDVDQFLDELFSPVLDGNLDELSDARSLAASIKGGGLSKLDRESSDDREIENNDSQEEIEGFEDFLDEIMGKVDPLVDMSKTSQIVDKIKGGGHRNRTNSQGSSALDKEVENLTSPKPSHSNHHHQQQQAASGGGGSANVDDYISDLFRPIFINDSLKTLTEKHNLVDAIKGGGTTHHQQHHQQNGASGGPSSYTYHHSSIPAPMVGSPPTTILMPLLSPTRQLQDPSFMPVFNLPPNTVLPPNETDLASYQQNLQRAFLQSAMAQNIQIQQQLLAQNQALQQLLTQHVTTTSTSTAATAEVKVTETVQATVKTHQVRGASSQSPIRKSSFKVSNGNNGTGAIRKSSSPSVNNSSRKGSSESNMSFIVTSSSSSRNGIPPPPPPPMPPPIDCTDPSEARPFMDPYGRAKTVRIGKWRWPPPQDEKGMQENGTEDFMQFKMRQHQRKVTPVKDQTTMITNGHPMSSSHKLDHQLGGGGTSAAAAAAEWEEIEFESSINLQIRGDNALDNSANINNNSERPSKNSSNKRSYDIGASRPSPGSVGKLKLSSEMRQRLEKVTANHSVRSTSSSKQDKPSRAINKLEDTRKMMLEQQLSGRWGDDSQQMDMASGKSSPVTPPHHHISHNGNNSPTQQSWASSSNTNNNNNGGSNHWKQPGPPPPPIGPGSLPPVPSQPPPPPPVVRPSPSNNNNNNNNSHQQLQQRSISPLDLLLQPTHPRGGLAGDRGDLLLPPQLNSRGVGGDRGERGESSTSSFMAQRQDRDTFGVHQNRAIHQLNNSNNNNGSSKRNSFSANWETHSALTHDCGAEDGSRAGTYSALDGSHWAKDGLLDTMDLKNEDHSRYSTRDSWDQADSSSIDQPGPPTRRIIQERWDVERKNNNYEKNNGRANPGKDSSGGGGDRPTFRTHQFNKSALEREKKHSVASTQMTDKTERNEVQEWPEFMRPIQTPPPRSPTRLTPAQQQQSNAITNSNTNLISTEKHTNQNNSPKTSTRLLPLGASACITYNRVSWLLRVRKEVFSPNEPLGPPSTLHLIFCQIAADVYGITPCLRLTQSEKRAGVNMLSGYGITAENFNSNHRANVKRNVIELARTWPLYFARLFPVSGAAQLSEVQLVAVSHWGVHLVKREHNHLQVLKSFSLKEISSCTAPRPTSVSFDSPQMGRLSLHTPRAQQLSEMVTKFCAENRKLQLKTSSPTRPSPSERIEVSPPRKINANTNNTSNNNNIINNSNNASGSQVHQHQQDRMVPSPTGQGPPFHNRNERTQSPSSPVPPSGKFSLMQFALHNFRQCSELELLKMDSSSAKSKEKKGKEWTWKQQTDLIKWQGTPIDGPLLRLEQDPSSSESLGPLAVECFECILRYCGDLPLTPEMSEVKCVYTVLMHCHKHTQLRDEVYCQLMKQTTSNKSDSPESCQRAWRLLSIVAAYFACSDNLLPFLTEHLSSAASDRRRVCHGTAAVCLANLRKTQRCGGRKNVPSVEEVTAVSAGRSARRQIYRLPGGAERVVNTRCSTVVADVISELCGLIGVQTDAEQQEFSLYCIVQGDAFTMPLAADEYILDVTTELHKAAQPFYLIFCRSVWYHPLKHDASPLYTEVLFNQVAPDYLEGLLLRLGNPNLPPSLIRDMALIAALLHRAADLNHSPSLKEVKFLLPKPVLGLREPRPPQWLALVQTSWGQAAGLQVPRAKHRVLQVLSNWPLFGSSFFAVKRVLGGDLDNWQEHILALNRHGVHFLEMTTHETLQHWPFAEVISTRKVRSEDGALFLDMKCGNLLQQRVTRLQTEQAHEISRLVRQYINLEQTNNSSGGRHHQ